MDADEVVKCDKCHKELNCFIVDNKKVWICLNCQKVKSRHKRAKKIISNL